MKNRRLVSRFLAAALTCTMMGSLAITANALTVDPYVVREAGVSNLEDGPAAGADILISQLGAPPLPETTTPPLNAENEPKQNTATGVSVEQLLILRNCLYDIYYLEARVKTLEDYNTFDPHQGYFTFKNTSDLPKSICEDLKPTDRKFIATISTYQAFTYVKQTEEYQTNEQLRAHVDRTFDNFMKVMPVPVRESMMGFVPRSVSDQLDPDQLVVIGKLIIGTEQYQQLKSALAPIEDLYTEGALAKTYSAAEITLIYDEIINATMAIWPQGVPERGLALGTKPDGSQTLVPIPTASKGN